MDPKKQKMIAPIVVTAIMLVYYGVYFGFLISVVEGVWKLLLGILPPAFGAVTVKVCIDRIKEIRKGEEDDLSQY